MSVCWIDYDNDGAEDLYVANMWTAAGVRVAVQDAFKQESSPESPHAFQKARDGELALSRIMETKFENATTLTAGCGVGRWAWSSDAFDFDHDGFPIFMSRMAWCRARSAMT